MIGLAATFLAAFVAATPVPMQSEPVFLGFLAAGGQTIWLVLAASVGNTLGACVTYVLGRGADALVSSRLFPVSPERLARAQAWFSRWGAWTLLLSWAPGGDLIVALSGLMRLPFMLFLPLVALAKTVRYSVLALAAWGVFGWGQASAGPAM
ncbi:MAG: DedA family protein [Rhodobacteraceae bacterium]|jgi:membrane protein YqaA with SNARE-associated domain|nr:DedA family protein [Paracoccaceae bacterium]